MARESLWTGINKYVAMKIGAKWGIFTNYPEMEFLELKIVCDIGVEGSHILPTRVLSMITT
jgi:hypothetical protein